MPHVRSPGRIVSLVWKHENVGRIEGEGFIWRDWVIEKIIEKHGVEPEEVEETFFNSPHKVRRSGSGKYQLFGQSEDGRYLFIVFAWQGRQIRVITARDMTTAERRYYRRK